MIEEAERAFWWFVCERQAIWHRRFVELRETWTDDPILRDCHFTNVYRELDRGTMWFYKQLTAKRLSAENPPALLWCSVVYRLVNRLETFDAFGGIPIMLHEADRQWVQNPHPSIEFWSGDEFVLSESVTLIRAGGHFPGSTVFHWADGPREGTATPSPSRRGQPSGKRENKLESRFRCCAIMRRWIRSAFAGCAW